MSEWKHFINKGKQDEKRFAQRHLSDIKWATKLLTGFESAIYMRS